ncbi:MULTISPECIES: hypothetical protein [Cupriavidus]|nr:MULTISPECIES: hypothetical protein [Cupriavidus]HBD37242.1 hypothetical protein [Cupriavidus sp.]AZG12051.1 hypothetical protein EHF44_00785 [Cupriavidus pauculus]MWL91719.1 hypothetical protein [Cupriavidus sp. SW-Y-13]QBP14444.1 hypothetical protein DDF84_032535 [Cupriavidus metallidurans]QGS31191.1 hypothetical protein FOB83_19900 [Cupriavidus metallidurans]
MKRSDMIGALMLGVTLAAFVMACIKSGVGLAFWNLPALSEEARAGFGKTFLMDFIMLNVFFVAGPLTLYPLFGQSQFFAGRPQGESDGAIHPGTHLNGMVER